MRDIKKLKVAKHVYELAADDWLVLHEQQQIDVVRALANPVRRAILRLLGLGPMRKAELARQIHTVSGRKYSRSLVQHHLKLLEQAKLIGYVADPKVSDKAKLVYRSASVRIQFKPEPVPEGAPRIPAEMIEAELRRELKEETEEEK